MDSMVLMNVDKVKENALDAADFLKVLSNSNRLMILCHLVKGEMCVSDLEKQLDISQSALSQHLSRMRSEGLVATRRESQQIFYRINDRRVSRLLMTMEDIFCD